MPSEYIMVWLEKLLVCIWILLDNLWILSRSYSYYASIIVAFKTCCRNEWVAISNPLKCTLRIVKLESHSS